MSLALRWSLSVFMQLVLSALFGLIGPYAISQVTGYNTIWLLPPGIAIGAWLGSAPLWSLGTRTNWYAFIGAAVGSLTTVLLARIGWIVISPPFIGVLIWPVIGVSLAVLKSRCFK